VNNRCSGSIHDHEARRLASVMHANVIELESRQNDADRARRVLRSASLLRTAPHLVRTSPRETRTCVASSDLSSARTPMYFVRSVASFLFGGTISLRICRFWWQINMESYWWSGSCMLKFTTGIILGSGYIYIVCTLLINHQPMMCSRATSGS
jgi:hypothetical protein